MGWSLLPCSAKGTYFDGGATSFSNSWNVDNWVITSPGWSVIWDTPTLMRGLWQVVYQITNPGNPTTTCPASEATTGGGAGPPPPTSVEANAINHDPQYPPVSPAWCASTPYSDTTSPTFGYDAGTLVTNGDGSQQQTFTARLPTTPPVYPGRVPGCVFQMLSGSLCCAYWNTCYLTSTDFNTYYTSTMPRMFEFQVSNYPVGGSFLPPSDTTWYSDRNVPHYTTLQINGWMGDNPP